MGLHADAKRTSVYMTEVVTLAVEQLWKLGLQSHASTWGLQH